MIKGLAITPPVLGRIAIGHLSEQDGRRRPVMDDEFRITSQVQSPEGWVRHPIDEQLRAEQGEGKLRRIPVGLPFSEPSLNLRAEYALFDRDAGRPLCVGDGEQCRRRTPDGMATLPCPAPEGCEFAAGGRCKPYGRLNVVIGDEDPLGTFIFRTTGFNSIRTLAARLAYFQAVSGKRLACLPLELRLRGKSTRQSFGRPIFYVDLTLRQGWSLEETLAEAQRVAQQRQAMGFDQRALDKAARQGLANGAFEDSAEEHAEIAEEFAPEAAAPSEAGSSPEASTGASAVSLADKLAERSSVPSAPDQPVAPEEAPPASTG